MNSSLVFVHDDEATPLSRSSSGSEEHICGLSTQELDEVDFLEAFALRCNPAIEIYDSTALPDNLYKIDRDTFTILRDVNTEPTVYLWEFKFVGKWMYPTSYGLTLTAEEFYTILSEECYRRRRDPFGEYDYEFNLHQGLHVNMEVGKHGTMFYMFRDSPLNQFNSSDSHQTLRFNYEGWQCFFKLSAKISHIIINNKLDKISFKSSFLKRGKISEDDDRKISAEKRSILLKTLYSSMFPNGYVGYDNPISLFDFHRYIIVFDFRDFVRNFVNKLVNIYTEATVNNEFLDSIKLKYLCHEMDYVYNITVKLNDDSDNECC